MLVALTGGIGSGKSTVAARLARLGAVVVDADALAREVVAPGSPGLASVVAEFGPGVLLPDGSLDRPAVATIVFADEPARHRLEAIVHPLVGDRAAELVAGAPADAVVVYDVPLLAESPQSGLRPVEGFDAVVVVEAPAEDRLARLVARGMPDEDARARMAAQASDEVRRAIADHVLVNDADLDALHAQVDALWAGLTTGPAHPRD